MLTLFISPAFQRPIHEPYSVPRNSTSSWLLNLFAGLLPRSGDHLNGSVPLRISIGYGNLHHTGLAMGIQCRFLSRGNGNVFVVSQY